MMKKWISLVLGVVMLGTMAACGDPSNAALDPQGSSVPPSSSSEELSQPEASESTASAAPSLPEEAVVYMTTDISPEGLMAVYDALNWTPTGNVAVKLSTGEPPSSNYLRPELIADLVQAVDGTIVECNTAYGGSRAETAMHYQVAEDHGFTAIAPFQIQDENGSMTLPVEGGTRLAENYVGAAFSDYDSYLVLSHFKGHSMAGYAYLDHNIYVEVCQPYVKNYCPSALDVTTYHRVWLDK